MKVSGKGHKTKKLQLFLSHNGVCSRRRAMEKIQSGDVTVNGKKVCEPSFQVEPASDLVKVDGKTIDVRKLQYILMNKPKGYVTAKVSQFGHKTVYDILPQKFDILSPAGRLDQDTEGLLVLTNDGDCAYRLTHPKFNVDKTYVVCVKDLMTNATKKSLERGIVLEGRRTARARVGHINHFKGSTSFHITIHEGRKRQIRYMLKKVGHPVISLKRVSQGPLRIGTLKVGRFRELSPLEVKDLKAL